MSCEERKLVGAIADALGCPPGAAMICRVASARATPDHADATDRGQASHAPAPADQPAREETQPDWAWLDRATVPTCGSNRAVRRQRLRRMPELLTAVIRQSSPGIAAATRRTQRAIEALDARDIVAIAALDDADAAAARALVGAFGIADDDGIPASLEGDHRLRNAALGAAHGGNRDAGRALARIGRRNDALRVARAAAVGNADAAIAAIASGAMSPLDILASFPPETAARTLASPADVRHAIARDVSQMHGHGRICAGQRACCRASHHA